MSATQTTDTTRAARLSRRAWRSTMGPMPAVVRDALLQSSRDDLGAAWRRVDACCAIADGDRRWAHEAHRYLTDEVGCSVAEADAVIAWIWPVR